MKKVVLKVIALLGIVAAMSACSKGSDGFSAEDLIGEWQMLSIRQYYGGQWYSFTAEEMGAEDTYLIITETTITSGNYNYPQGTMTARYHLDGNTFVLDGGYEEYGGDYVTVSVVSVSSTRLVTRGTYDDGQIDELTYKRVNAK